MGNLTDKETEILSLVLQEFESQFHKDEGAQADVFNYDKEWIDIEVSYDDESTEQMKIDRSLLSSGLPVKEIALDIS